MSIFLMVVAALSGLAIVACICLQTASPDAGFSAAMGGSGGGSSRKGGTDLMLERLLKVNAVIWIVACLALAYVESHAGIG